MVWGVGKTELYGRWIPQRENLEREGWCAEARKEAVMLQGACSEGGGNQEGPGILRTVTWCEILKLGQSSRWLVSERFPKSYAPKGARDTG